MRIDGLFLADFAQESNGKLNMIGAGWNNIFSPNDPPIKHRHMALAGLIEVGWNEANEQIPIEIDLVNADEVSVLGTPIQGSVVAGRPAGAAPGEPLVLPIVVDFEDLEFPQFGTYCFKVSLNGSPVKRVKFHVMKIGAPPGSG